MTLQSRGSAKTILIIEDDPDLRSGLRRVFEAEGFRVDEAADGAAAMDRAAALPPDAVILDIMIPSLDGFAVCRELRARGLIMPVLILTARSSEIDRVLGFELGADDYVTKPFSIQELVLRVRALLRRSPARAESGLTIRFGDVTADLRTYKLRRGAEAHELYHYEAEILKLLLGREGQVVSRQDILDEVWGRDSSPTARTVDFHVCNLRKKIEADPARPKHLLTVHGIGYRFIR